MSTIDEYRQAVTAAVETAKSGFTEFPVVIEYDNRVIVDPARQEDPYLTVEFMLGTAWQADLADKPFHRVVGALILTVKDKQGNGTARSNRLLEHFYPQLQRRNIGGVNLQMADLKTKSKVVDGIWGVSAVIPFWINKTY